MRLWSFVISGLAMLCAPMSGAAQDQALVTAAKAILDSVQANSFAANREYCGLLGFNQAGQIVATRPRKGRRDSCIPRDFFDAEIEPIASYHTHGAYDPEADAEVPSLGDLDADTEEGLEYGFMSSPGGRFWVIDPARAEVRQICGVGCMVQDPNFSAGDHGPIAQRYSRDALLARDDE